MANIPTQTQIEAIAAELIGSLGCNVYYGDVLFLVDARYPGMTDAEFDSIRPLMGQVTETARTAEIRRVWN